MLKIIREETNDDNLVTTMLKEVLSEINKSQGPNFLRVNLNPILGGQPIPNPPYSTAIHSASLHHHLYTTDQISTVT